MSDESRPKIYLLYTEATECVRTVRQFLIDEYSVIYDFIHVSKHPLVAQDQPDAPGMNGSTEIAINPRTGRAELKASLDHLDFGDLFLAFLKGDQLPHADSAAWEQISAFCKVKSESIDIPLIPLTDRADVRQPALLSAWGAELFIDINAIHVGPDLKGLFADRVGRICRTIQAPIFISYRVSDGLPFARQLANYLTDEKKRYVNWDDGAITTSDHDCWKDTLLPLLKLSSCVLFIDTMGVHSGRLPETYDYVNRELRHAFQHDWPVFSLYVSARAQSGYEREVYGLVKHSPYRIRVETDRDEAIPENKLSLIDEGIQKMLLKDMVDRARIIRASRKQFEANYYKWKHHVLDAPHQYPFSYRADQYPQPEPSSQMQYFSYISNVSESPEKIGQFQNIVKFDAHDSAFPASFYLHGDHDHYKKVYTNKETLKEFKREHKLKGNHHVIPWTRIGQFIPKGPKP